MVTHVQPCGAWNELPLSEVSCALPAPSACHRALCYSMFARIDGCLRDTLVTTRAPAERVLRPCLQRPAGRGPCPGQCPRRRCLCAAHATRHGYTGVLVRCSPPRHLGRPTCKPPRRDTTVGGCAPPQLELSGTCLSASALTFPLVAPASHRARFCTVDSARAPSPLLRSSTWLLASRGR